MDRPDNVRCFIPFPLTLNEPLPFDVTVGVIKPLFSIFHLRPLVSTSGVSLTFDSERDADAARRRNAANIANLSQVRNN